MVISVTLDYLRFSMGRLAQARPLRDAKIRVMSSFVGDQ